MGDSQREAQDALRTYEWLLRKGYFGAVGVLLDDTDPEKLSPTEILVILNITSHGKEHLPRRDRFVERAEVALRKQLNDDDRVARLLENRR